MAEINRTCPACGDGNGIPKSVTAMRRMIVLRLACEVCGHEWTTERREEPVYRFLVPPEHLGT
jgi:uncharacterized protein (DUF983 family)